ncbi:MAG: DUF1015 family protein [Planctomycetota bacterium]
MVRIRPFAALRPKREIASKLAAPPYDVLSSEEARELIKGNDYSFLRISKPESTLPADIDIYDDRVYARGLENFTIFRKNGWLVQDDEPHLYVYRQIMGEHCQTGLVAAASTLDYEEDRIKKHELTRIDKEDDRMRHIETLNAQTGPVFLTYRAVKAIDEMVATVTENEEPEYDFVDELNVRHIFWVIRDFTLQEAIIREFAGLDVMYVADGHHRSASATRVMKKRRELAGSAFTGNEEYTGFLSVIFPHDQMQIMGYNRVVKSIPLPSEDDLLTEAAKVFTVEEVQGGQPDRVGDIRMYFRSRWFKLTPKQGTYDASDPVASLDVDILQKNLLAPVLNIEDPRKSKEIDFVGGIRGIGELTQLVDSGKFKVAFSLFPVTVEQLMAIADSGKIMPPKSTWFEPKLRSGLAIHLLD